MELNQIKNQKTPSGPGCYLFYNRQQEIIYIGKAANLQSRVLSYWQKSAQHSPAKEGMLKKVAKITWLETASEIEALLLEANLIKKHQPYFNVVMRDDKRFSYIKISTEETYPRIFLTRKIDQSGHYFGPFTSTEAVKQTLKVIRKIWPFRTCLHMPKKVCLYYQINKCPGPCEVKIEREEYKKRIKQIILFLEGKRKQVETRIKKEIKKLEKEKVKLSPDKNEYLALDRKIKQLNYQLHNLEEVLKHTKILSLKDKYASDVLELAKVLSLPKIPERIEGYDISNIFGKIAVGSMVVFKEGEPEKNHYRKFKLKADQARGDVANLEEVLLRRFGRITYPKKEAWPLPDLIILDGGKAQLNVGVKILKKYSLDIPILAISKGEKLRSARAQDKIFFPGQKEPLKLPLASPALHVVKRVRDEAHRFAINYHRQQKRKIIK